MNILITGANGFIGQHLFRMCLRHGHQISVCMHQASASLAFSDAKLIQVDFTRDHDIAVWLERLQAIDVVINCVGIIRQKNQQTFDAIHYKAACALFKACEIAAIRKVIQISALGAGEGAISEFLRTKKAADDCLSSLALDWTILKPSIVYGEGARSMAFFKALAALPLTPIPGNGKQLVQPLHIDDLCATVLLALESNCFSRKRVELGGANALSLKAMLSQIKSYMGMAKHRFIGLPNRLASLATELLGSITNAPVTSDTLKMLNSGSVTDSKTLFELSTIRPRSFRAGILEEFSNKSGIINNRQYFLLPLLRLSLALLWIYSGFVSAFAYPLEQSLAMLERLGLDGGFALFLLYAAAFLDVILGLALLLNKRTALVLKTQILLILTYSVLISFSMPELWLHPFAPLAKNLPLLVSSLLLLVNEG